MDFKLISNITSFALLVSFAGCQATGELVDSQLYDPTQERFDGTYVVKASRPDPALDSETSMEPEQIEPLVEAPTGATMGRSTPQTYPTAEIAPDNPGFVKAPFGGDGLVDVRGMAPGTLAKDPYSGKPFLIPVMVAVDE